MKLGLRWLFVPAMAVTLASCAATYGNGYGATYYGGYADYAYPTDFYPPAYGGIVLGGGRFHHFPHNGVGHHGLNHAAFGHPHGFVPHAGAGHAGMVHDGGHHGGMGAHGGHAGGAGHR